MADAGGFVGIGFPEDLAVALEQRFRCTGAPRASAVVFSPPRGAGGGAAATNMAVPPNAWFIRDNPIKIDDLGFPHFRKLPHGALHNWGYPNSWIV